MFYPARGLLCVKNAKSNRPCPPESTNKPRQIVTGRQSTQAVMGSTHQNRERQEPLPSLHGEGEAGESGRETALGYVSTASSGGYYSSRRPQHKMWSLIFLD